MANVWKTKVQRSVSHGPVTISLTMIHDKKGRLIPGGGGGEGVLKKNWVGVCGPLPKTLTLFMTKICDFPYPIYDLK